jgi:hypothetical protein
MTARRGIPTYEQPVTIGQNMSQSWRRWFHDIEVGTPPSNEVEIVLTASPFTYQSLQRGYIIISGGTVSKIAFSRTAGIFYNTGQTSGMFSVNLGDSMQVIYASVPTLVFVPS